MFSLNSTSLTIWPSQLEAIISFLSEEPVRCLIYWLTIIPCSKSMWWPILIIGCLNLKTGTSFRSFVILNDCTELRPVLGTNLGELQPTSLTMARWHLTARSGSLMTYKKQWWPVPSLNMNSDVLFLFYRGEVGSPLHTWASSSPSTWRGERTGRRETGGLRWFVARYLEEILWYLFCWGCCNLKAHWKSGYIMLNKEHPKVC